VMPAVPRAMSTAAGVRTAATLPTIVLVHGAWADGSGWEGVVRRLQSDGYPVVVPANPLRGLPGDSAYVAGVLRSVAGPVILVGHSYGGAVITNAALGDPAVKALVYVDAFVPDVGETVLRAPRTASCHRRIMARRARAHIIEVDASHPAMISHPDVVTGVIREAAGAAAWGIRPLDA
jgi:pimeloyl-ACP methyl ester carboxylesterase